MHTKIKKQLKKYLNYLDGLPDTPNNKQIIDCTNLLIIGQPDTEDSLNA